ncbi:hypothetical protein HRI_000028900 [Hibiscus trionum]|uniref:Ripening-related protein 1 n=1 Tax=Hibiscus trionum TaxID=183268 RepID=A0A9W7GT35_HIBTR|nr:hypothetical protein HRI_000028900 [Hibiscus trionum]
MKKQTHPTVLILVCILFLFPSIQSHTCKPSGKIRAPKPRSGQCTIEDDPGCCKEGKLYATYTCSPPVSNHTKATLTLDSFEAGGDGRAPSKCDNRYHSDDKQVVGLSTGWFNKRKRCLEYINIQGNGKMVKAMVVEECDSRKGCDAKHGYYPPCRNNIVVASKAVWKALDVPLSQWGEMNIYWSDTK